MKRPSRRLFAVALVLFASILGTGTAMAANATPALKLSKHEDGVLISGHNFPANSAVKLTAKMGDLTGSSSLRATGTGRFVAVAEIGGGATGALSVTATSGEISESAAIVLGLAALSSPVSESVADPVKPAPSSTPAGPSSAVSINTVYGITVTDIANIAGVVESVKALPQKPTVRVVFDEFMEPSYYKDALNQLKPHAFIMGELLDSFYVKDVSVAEYEARTTAYVEAFEDVVDIWEVGNETNGEWLGATADTVAKVVAAYNVVEARNLKSALTLYYNHECWADPSHEMFTWTDQNIPADMKSGLDYVWVSYYEVDCNGYQPTSWTTEFNKVHEMFPNSKLGFGEIGIPKPVTDATLGQAEEIMVRYYSVQVDTPNYVGGHFWWNAAQDLVPSSKPLHGVLKSLWT